VRVLASCRVRAESRRAKRRIRNGRSAKPRTRNGRNAPLIPRARVGPLGWSRTVKPPFRNGRNAPRGLATSRRRKAKRLAQNDRNALRGLVSSRRKVKRRTRNARNGPHIQNARRGPKALLSQKENPRIPNVPRGLLAPPPRKKAKLRIRRGRSARLVPTRKRAKPPGPNVLRVPHIPRVPPSLVPWRPGEEVPRGPNILAPSLAAKEAPARARNVRTALVLASRTAAEEEEEAPRAPNARRVLLVPARLAAKVPRSPNALLVPATAASVREDRVPSVRNPLPPKDTALDPSSRRRKRLWRARMTFPTEERSTAAAAWRREAWTRRRRVVIPVCSWNRKEARRLFWGMCGPPKTHFGGEGYMEGKCWMTWQWKGRDSGFCRR